MIIGRSNVSLRTSAAGGEEPLGRKDEVPCRAHEQEGVLVQGSESVEERLEASRFLLELILYANRVCYLEEG